MVKSMYIHNSTDAQLLALLAQDNQAAMTEIYHRYWRKLLAIGYNHSRDKSTAEEIVQSVLIKLWERRHNLAVESLSNYLAVSVKYSVYNYLLRASRHAQIETENFEQSDRCPDDERIYSQFLEKHLTNEIDSLPEKCRIVFKYSRYQGKTNRQISLELSISEKTVEAHISKALKTLKLSLKNTGWLTVLLFFIR